MRRACAARAHAVHKNGLEVARNPSSVARLGPRSVANWVTLELRNRVTKD